MSGRPIQTQRMATPNSSKPFQAVWDPGAKSVMYKNNSNKHRVSLNHKGDTEYTKDSVNSTSKLSRSPNTRASPNKSQDSGFSDSGESETSSSIKSSDNKPHITRVYFYSSSNISNNISESHYQSPSSLPVFSHNNILEKSPTKYSHSVSVQDISANRSKAEKNGLWVATSATDIDPEEPDRQKLKNRRSLSYNIKRNLMNSVKKDQTKQCNNEGKEHIRNKQYNPANEIDPFLPLSPEKSAESLKLQDKNQIPGQLTKIVTNLSQNSDSQGINSITVLLNEFRKEDSSYCDDKNKLTYPINSSPTAMSASISLPSSPSMSDFSENSSFSSGSSKYRTLTQDPIDHWLSELPSMYESECSVMLQSKSLQGLNTKDAPKCQTYEDIKMIQEHARQVSKCFADLCRNIGCKNLVASLKELENKVHELMSSNTVKKRKVSNLINEELLDLPGLKIKKPSHDTLDHDQEKNNVLVKEHQKILNLLYDLKVSATRVRKNQLAEIVEIVTQFGSCLTVMVELMLSTKVEVIVSSLKDPPSVSDLQTSLLNITSLGLEGNHLCRLIAKYGGVHLLVRLLTNNKFYSLRGAILRSLGTVCCVLEAIRQLEGVRGVEVIARMLGEVGTSEMERAEAAGVLAQVTSPWIEDNDYVLGVMENAFYLVKSLTDMCRNSKCGETFLLSSSALANLSFLTPLVLTAMSQMDTVSVLLSFLSHNVSPSIYIQDQVATVLANMAARQDTRDLLLNCDLVHVLLYLLAASPTNSQLPVMAATQRVQQKAAIAIARLSTQPSVVAGVLSGSGLERLVELSVCKKARLDSDSTLVAVITAVRKISLSQNITHLLENLGATDLLNPCLINSFKLFSTKHESFV